jgi:hypothetical protein
VGEVRGEGMLSAVEIVKNRDTREAFDPSEKTVPRIAEAMGRRGVIARAMPQGDIIGYAPPLSLSREEADTVVSVTRTRLPRCWGRSWAVSADPDRNQAEGTGRAACVAPVLGAALSKGRPTRHAFRCPRIFATASGPIP